jgi:hypothetical protein
MHTSYASNARFIQRIVAGFVYDVGMLLVFIFVGAGAMVGVRDRE